MDQGVGREIKRLREERGWSQAKLAVEAEMSVSGVSMIENGQRNLTTTTLAKLAEAFGLEIADLFPKAPSPALQLELAEQTGQTLLEQAVEAASRDIEKVQKALARLSASEGTPQGVSGYAEDQFRAELRALGFPDEYFEDFIWPLVLEAREARQLKQELAQRDRDTHDLERAET